jgi:hypothetical protein
MATILEITDITPDRFAQVAHQQTENGATKIERVAQANGLVTLRATYPDDAPPTKPGAGGTGGSSGGAGGGTPPGSDKGKSDTKTTDAATPLPRAFSRHGTFVYDAAATIADYGNVQNTVDAMVRAGMQHAWVRVHGTQAHGAAGGVVLQKLIDALQTADIAVAGWGWCQGVNSVAESRLALRELARYGLSDYIADIEHGTHDAQWSESEIQDFCARVREQLRGAFAISTYALIDWHEPQLMQAALEYVDAFAPQLYWFSFPNKKMADQFQRPDGARYRVNDAGEYAELCLDRWTRLSASSRKPLIMTGQAYWGEGNSQQSAEGKLDEFIAHWSRFERIVGLNWWHFGGVSGMSHAMLERITNARLGERTYA